MISAIIILLLCAIVIYVILSYSDSSEEFEENYYGNRLGNHWVFYKRDWNGRPPKAVVPLAHPVEFVIISHSASYPCDSIQICSGQVRNFQDWHFTLGNYDIGYSFVIGGDANIYVGRGWDVRSFHGSHSIGINFIGNFNFDQLNSSMINAAKLLIQQGLDLMKLSKDYILVGHNQTDTAVPVSPGENVYKEIKNWPHFSNRTYF